MRVEFSEDLWRRIHKYLDDSGERAIFLFVADSAGVGVWTTVDEWFLDVHRDYSASTELHVALGPDVVPRVIKRAHDLGCAVLEIHGHNWPGGKTTFSSYDIEQLQEVVPHVLWRLPDRPYFAVVVGPDSFDALAWLTRGGPIGLESLVVGGSEQFPTGRSIEKWHEEAPRDA